MDVTFIEESGSNINNQIAPHAQPDTGNHQTRAAK